MSIVCPVHVPPGWELKGEWSLQEPEASVALAANQLKQAVPKPRGNLQVRQWRWPNAKPADLLDAMIRELSGRLPGLKALPAGALQFGDGVMGTMADLSFEGTAQVRIVQRHAFRVDGDVVTQFVASVDDKSVAKLEQVYQPLIQRFTA